MVLAILARVPHRILMGRNIFQIAFCAALLCPCADARSNERFLVDADSEQMPQDNVVKLNGTGEITQSTVANNVNPSDVNHGAIELCHRVPDCACIRYTVNKMSDICGWCESIGRPMVGNLDEALSWEGGCNYWIFRGKECPTMYCRNDFTVSWWLWHLTPLMAILLLVVKFTRYDARSGDRVAKKMDLTVIRKSKQDFAEGPWGARPTIAETFQEYFSVDLQVASSMSHNFDVAKVACQRLFGNVISRLSWFMLWSCIYNTWIRLLPIYIPHRQWDVLSMTIGDLRKFAGMLNNIVGFLFSFYALGRVGWWWGVMDLARCLQGRSQDLAMIIGGASTVQEYPGAKDGSTWLDAKWHFYRFTMLLWVFGFKALNRNVGQIEIPDLISMGLLEEDEAIVLEQNPHWRVPFKWMNVWIDRNILDSQKRALLSSKLCDFRGTWAGMGDELEKRAPYTFEAILYMAVHVWIFMLPFAQENQLSDRTLMVESGIFVPTITSTINAFFYLSLIFMLEEFKDPYGLGFDDLRPEVIFLETERAMVDWLTTPVPASLGPLLTEELNFPKDHPEKMGALDVEAG